MDRVSSPSDSCAVLLTNNSFSHIQRSRKTTVGLEGAWLLNRARFTLTAGETSLRWRSIVYVLPPTIVPFLSLITFFPISSVIVRLRVRLEGA